MNSEPKSSYLRSGATQVNELKVIDTEAKDRSQGHNEKRKTPIGPTTTSETKTFGYVEKRWRSRPCSALSRFRQGCNLTLWGGSRIPDMYNGSMLSPPTSTPKSCGRGSFCTPHSHYLSSFGKIGLEIIWLEAL